MNDKRKTKAKAAGLKSVFFDPNQAILTTFEKGDKAAIEKKVEGQSVLDMRNPHAFELKLKERQLQIIGKNKINTVRENPLITAPSKRQMIREERMKRAIEENRPYHIIKAAGEDDLRAKSQLEKQYFGREFNDNIKIQIIYNILDINKIIAPYINDIIYSMNNLSRNERQEDDNKIDIIGNLISTGDYVSFRTPSPYPDKEKNNKRNRDNYDNFLKAAKPYMRYYGKVFIKEVKKTRIKEEKRDKLEIIHRSDGEVFTIFQILSFVRQNLMHSGKNASSIFNIEDYSETFRTFLKEIYRQKINEINKGFIDNNSHTNFSILYDLYGLEENTKNTKEIVQEFYDFVIKADSKNIGFSLKKLREHMLDLPEAVELKNKQFDTVRSKLYTMLDFMIYHHYVSNQTIINEIVEHLRTTLTDEAKEYIYLSQAKILWNALGSIVFEKLVPMMNGDSLKEMKKENKSYKLPESLISTVLAKPDANVFSCLIYFLTLFLDGKEINEMVSNLITKFENIDSLLEVDKKVYRDTNEELDLESLIRGFKGKVTKKIDDQKLNGELLGVFKLFNDAKKISEELKIIKNITRMDKEIYPSEGVFLDAAKVLGIKKQNLDYDSDTLANDLDSDFNKNIVNVINGTKEDRNLRNFIINNVIKSRRFQYIARHMNMNHVKKLAQSEALNRFVLTKMNDTKIIDRYYESVSGQVVTLNQKAKIDYLVKKLHGLTFEDFIDVKQKVSENTLQSKEKAQKQALVGLYLTVLYLIYKNLVNINARYTTAFYCLERDSALKGLEIKWDDLESCKGLANHFIEKNYLPVRKAGLLKANLTHLDNENGFKFYRNQVTHLNAIRVAHMYINDIKFVDSYFALYHYVMQRHLLTSLQKYPDNQGFVIESLVKAKTNGVYSKDFLHVIHAPFGYNSARYKNLSIQDLFDKNEVKPEVNLPSTND